MVVTNVPLNLGRLNEYMADKWSPSFTGVPAQLPPPSDTSDETKAVINESVRHITERVLLIDEDDLSKFFTFRAGGVRLQSITNAEWKTGKRPDYSIVKDGGVLYVLDEVHIAFNSRAWADTGAEVLYYLSQHRKLGDDVVCITQSVANVDKQFRSVAQDYTYIKNLSKQKVGLFRLPAIFTRNTYPQPATDTSKPMESGTFRLDVSGLASCYDTARGVGIHGRSGADTQSRKKGISTLWFVVLLIALGVLLKYLPAILTHFLSHEKSKPAVHQAASSSPVAVDQSTNTPPALLAPPAFTLPGRARTDAQDPPPLVCVGYCMIAGHPNVFLSDGRTVTEADGVQSIERNAVFFDGKKIPIVPGQALSQYQPEPVQWDPIVTLPPRPQGSIQIIPFGNPSPRQSFHLGGMASMQRQTAPTPQGSMPFVPGQ